MRAMTMLRVRPDSPLARSHEEIARLRRSATLRRRRAARLAVSAAVLAVTATAAPSVSASPAAAPEPRVGNAGSVVTLSQIRPSRLVQSTANLYWTTNVDPPITNSVGYSRIYRMSKAGAPGTERLIYEKAHAGSFFVWAFVYARINGRWYAYFVENNAAERTSAIKRVPLGGGTAVTIVASPRYISTRDLASDWTYLYWADEGGLRRVRIDGTGLATLYVGTLLRSVAIDQFRVYFSSGRQIRSVFKQGGSSRAELTAGSDVTDLSVVSTMPTSLFWSESNGSVRGRNFLSERVTYQGTDGTRRARSVYAVDDRHVFWTDCLTALGPSSCRMRAKVSQATVVATAGSFPLDVQADSEAIYWHDSLGIRKLTQ